MAKEARGGSMSGTKTKRTPDNQTSHFAALSRRGRKWRERSQYLKGLQTLPRSLAHHFWELDAHRGQKDDHDYVFQGGPKRKMDK